LDRDHLIAILAAYLVTFLWSSSYILVKIGLTEIPPLTLVALRYIIASAALFPIAYVKGETNLVGDWKTLLKLLFLGISGYTVAQGLQCVGLSHLPAVSVTFILNFTPVIVLILGIVSIGEYPTPFQLVGMLLALAGAYIYFNAPLSSTNLLGVMITLISGIGWAIYIVASRLLFIKGQVSTLSLTASPMIMGTILLATASLSLEGLPNISISSWTIIIWLGLINTAIAFFLWNHSLQKLEAFEISVLQNTMLVQIAILAWIFLGETLTTAKIIPMVMVLVGALMVQLRK